MTDKDGAATRLEAVTRTFEENSALAIRWRGYATKTTATREAHEGIAGMFASCAQVAETELRTLKALDATVRGE